MLKEIKPGRNVRHIQNEPSDAELYRLADEDNMIGLYFVQAGRVEMLTDEAAYPVYQRQSDQACMPKKSLNPAELRWESKEKCKKPQHQEEKLGRSWRLQT